MTFIDSGEVDVAFRRLILETARAVLAERVYPVQLPDNVRMEDGPATVYSLVSDLPHYVNGNDSGFRRMRYQVDSFGASLRVARQADDAIRAGLSGYRGRMHGFTLAVWRMNTYPVFYEGEGLFRVVSDYAVGVVC